MQDQDEKLRISRFDCTALNLYLVTKFITKFFSTPWECCNSARHSPCIIWNVKLPLKKGQVNIFRFVTLLHYRV